MNKKLLHKNIKFNIILFFVFGIFIFLFSYICQLLWNLIIPSLYEHAPIIDYSQSFLVVTFLSIISFIIKLWSDI